MTQQTLWTNVYNILTISNENKKIKYRHTAEKKKQIPNHVVKTPSKSKINQNNNDTTTPNSNFITTPRNNNITTSTNKVKNTKSLRKALPMRPFFFFLTVENVTFFFFGDRQTTQNKITVQSRLNEKCHISFRNCRTIIKLN